jgi:hypothetical protein
MRGYSRDEKKGNVQIEYGLLTDPEGRPVAVRAFGAKAQASGNLVTLRARNSGLDRSVEPSSPPSVPPERATTFWSAVPARSVSGKNTLAWDTPQARAWDAFCRRV